MQLRAELALFSTVNCTVALNVPVTGAWLVDYLASADNTHIVGGTLELTDVVGEGRGRAKMEPAVRPSAGPGRRRRRRVRPP